MDHTKVKLIFGSAAEQNLAQILHASTIMIINHKYVSENCIIYNSELTMKDVVV